MNTSAKFTMNRTETVGGVVCTSIFKSNQGAITKIFLMDFSQNLRLAHLQLLMNTSAKFKVNQTETVGGIVWTSTFKSNQGNNSVIIDGILTKFASCTSTAPNEHF